MPVVPHYPSDEPDDPPDAPDLDRIRERLIGGDDGPTPTVAL